MKYNVVLTKKAKQGIEFFKDAGNWQAVEKIELMLEEIEIHPKTGQGKPERARHIPGNV